MPLKTCFIHFSFSFSYFFFCKWFYEVYFKTDKCFEARQPSFILFAYYVKSVLSCNKVGPLEIPYFVSTLPKCFHDLHIHVHIRIPEECARNKNRILDISRKLGFTFLCTSSVQRLFECSQLNHIIGW